MINQDMKNNKNLVAINSHFLQPAIHCKNRPLYDRSGPVILRAHVKKRDKSRSYRSPKNKRYWSRFCIEKMIHLKRPPILAHAPGTHIQLAKDLTDMFTQNQEVSLLRRAHQEIREGLLLSISSVALPNFQPPFRLHVIGGRFALIAIVTHAVCPKTCARPGTFRLAPPHFLKIT